MSWHICRPSALSFRIRMEAHGISTQSSSHRLRLSSKTQSHMPLSNLDISPQRKEAPCAEDFEDSDREVQQLTNGCDSRRQSLSSESGDAVPSMSARDHFINNRRSSAKMSFAKRRTSVAINSDSLAMLNSNSTTNPKNASSAADPANFQSALDTLMKGQSAMLSAIEQLKAKVETLEKTAPANDNKG